MSSADVSRLESDLRFYKKVLENTKRSVNMGISGMTDQATRVEATILTLEIQLREAKDAETHAVQGDRKRRVPRKRSRAARKKAKR